MPRRKPIDAYAAQKASAHTAASQAGARAAQKASAYAAAQRAGTGAAGLLCGGARTGLLCGIFRGRSCSSACDPSPGWCMSGTHPGALASARACTAAITGAVRRGAQGPAVVLRGHAFRRLPVVGHIAVLYLSDARAAILH